MIIEETDYLEHYGTLHKSGRYPWGSGGNPVHSWEFLDYVDNLRKQGLSQVEISRGLDISTTQLRARRTIANNEKKQAQINQAERLALTGMSKTAIGKEMGLNESSVRALLAPGAKEKADILTTTANMLKDQVTEKKYIDVGSGVEQHIGVGETKLKAAIAILQEQGYVVRPLNNPQLATGFDTRMKVLAAPGTTQKEVWENRDNIKQVTSSSDDGGRTQFGLLPPIKVDPKRVSVRYGDEGGKETDGVIYVRPDVPDLSLGKARYAQVRIAVGDGHYLKGMAMYKEDLPRGTDLLFNTAAKRTSNKLDALKEVTGDEDNPFGAIVDQLKVDNPDGTKKVISAMNIVNEEGDWLKWSKTIASQVLSKQEPSLAKAQLNVTFEDRKKEFGEILNLTNPTVRKKLLRTFSDSTDSAAVHLKAARLPRQGWHAILPIDSMPPTQIFAPNFRDGERVVLIRYPHGGTFEIPELVVNNKQPEARRLLQGARDAVGIHHSVAQRLSGADFDGDAVLVIPNDSNKIKVSPALEGLRNFDPGTEYKGYEGMPKMTSKQKGLEMGAISNLITDMTIQGANTTDLAAAIRHSMVVIDAEKHNLNYKESARVNGIRRLKERYQGKANAGASTLISRAGAKVFLPNRKLRRQSQGGPIDPVTGRKVFEPTNEINFRTGKPKLTRFDKLAEVQDAHLLSSGTRIERLYADHSNKLKAMANSARLEMINTPLLKYSSSARKVYEKEVLSLNAKLNIAIRNRPLERQANILANAVIKAKKVEKPNMDDASFKKMKFQALDEMRKRTGAKKSDIIITPSEWEAIQAGAIHDNKLSQILDKADLDVVRQLATPRRELKMTPSKTDRAQRMLADGFTRAEVASQLGVSLTTLDVATNG